MEKKDDNFDYEINTDDLSKKPVYYRELREINVLTSDEQRELLIKAQNGDEQARAFLIESNLRLVFYFAKSYFHTGLSFDELIQEGNYGLILAVDKYDLSKYNVNFSTYAAEWIESYMRRYVHSQKTPIRVHEDTFYQLMDYNENKRILSAKFGRTATLQEVSLEYNYSAEDLRLYESLGKDTLSINSKVYQDSDDSMQDFIPDDNTNVENDVISSSLATAMTKMFENMDNDSSLLSTEKLKDRERIVLTYRYGFVDGHFYSLDQLGSILGITRERVRQIEVAALKKVRNYEGVASLVDYLEYPDDGKRFLESKQKECGYNIKKISLADYFKNYPISEVRKVVAVLPNKEKQIIYHIYGKTLKDTNFDSTFYYNLPLIKLIICKLAKAIIKDSKNLPETKKECYSDFSADNHMVLLRRLFFQGILTKEQHEEAKELCLSNHFKYISIELGEVNAIIHLLAMELSEFLTMSQLMIVFNKTKDEIIDINQKAALIKKQHLLRKRIRY